MEAMVQKTRVSTGLVEGGTLLLWSVYLTVGSAGVDYVAEDDGSSRRCKRKLPPRWISAEK